MYHYCVIGDPIAHSLSPKIHNRVFKKLKISACYEAVQVKPAELARFMAQFREKYAGANVTIPHKETVRKFLDEISSEAKAIGSVNTIVNNEGKLTGYNTDVLGFMTALKKSPAMRNKKLRGKKAIVFGAGGASRAVVYGLVHAGVNVAVLNRTPEHAKKLARDFGCKWGNLKDFDPTGCDIMVNTTSLGMTPNTRGTPVPNLRALLESHKKKPIVMDIVYCPRMTKLLRDAKKSGCEIITGDHMFLGQAAAAFNLWGTYGSPL